MAQFWYGAISSKEFEAFAVSVGMKAIHGLCTYTTLPSLTSGATQFAQQDCTIHRKTY